MEGAHGGNFKKSFSSRQSEEIQSAAIYFVFQIVIYVLVTGAAEQTVAKFGQRAGALSS
jgi:hypothetical protein